MEPSLPILCWIHMQKTHKTLEMFQIEHQRNISPEEIATEKTALMRCCGLRTGHKTNSLFLQVGRLECDQNHVKKYLWLPISIVRVEFRYSSRRDAHDSIVSNMGVAVSFQAQVPQSLLIIRYFRNMLIFSRHSEDVSWPILEPLNQRDLSHLTLLSTVSWSRN